MQYVQLSSDNKSVIAVFACPQDAVEYPNQVQVDDDDARLLAFKNPQSTIPGQIQALEMQQTPRRIREAILGTDGGWLKNLEVQITELRNQLK